ncbi:hypothetical protein D3C86_2001410 [compost metagenome]
MVNKISRLLPKRFTSIHQSLIICAWVRVSIESFKIPLKFVIDCIRGSYNLYGLKREVANESKSEV